MVQNVLKRALEADEKDLETPEVTAKLKELQAVFHKRVEETQYRKHTRPQTTDPQPASNCEDSGVGFLSCLSRLWRALTGDGPTAEAEAAAQRPDEPRRAEGQWPHVAEH
jgi:hypothetical protein